MMNLYWIRGARHPGGDSKLTDLRDLERDGIITEECPAENFRRYKLTANHTTNDLPKRLQSEYHQLGELRW